MRNFITAAIVTFSTWAGSAPPALACGGFFCSQAPVDQNAERIIFAVDEQTDSTEMIVQIAYQGDDDAFAWLLPVGAVPQNRQVFPNGALAPLDAQTGPLFQPPSSCRFGGDGDDDAAEESSADDSGVTVHVRETVGPFDIVVLESPEAEATFRWLVDNGYRLAPAMKPYIQLYTAQQMKFLALKLTATASVKDIQPFRMTLPGTTPTIPLRLTAVAAEPEMGVLVWIFGQRRYEPANAAELTIPKADLRWSPTSWPIRTNWAELVAREVDKQGGRGWVVEQAGSTAQLHSLLTNTFVSDEEQTKARDALLGLLSGRPYMTRLYTRVSAEEMSYDPAFRRSDKPDVSRNVELPDYDEVCSELLEEPIVDECDFAACGQLGLCSTAMDPVQKARVAACACAPGSSARTTFDARGMPTVACQDQRMSFMNPGESDESGGVFADPCVGFSCGDHGRCVAMNLTPTCECEAGYVAVGRIESGARRTECVKPMKAVPKAFYNRRPPALAAGMVAGRLIELPPPEAEPDLPMSDTYGAPRPSKPKKGGGCSVDASASGGVGAALSLLALSLTLYRRRRARA